MGMIYPYCGRIDLRAARQSYDCSNASEVVLVDVGKSTDNKP